MLRETQPRKNTDYADKAQVKNQPRPVQPDPAGDVECSVGREADPSPAKATS
jgi:hypothetical protein